MQKVETAGDCYIVADGILDFDGQGFAEVCTSGVYRLLRPSPLFTVTVPVLHLSVDNQLIHWVPLLSPPCRFRASTTQGPALPRCLPLPVICYPAPELCSCHTTLRPLSSASESTQGHVSG